MERKNYLLEKLSKEEKSYLKKMIVNVRRKYIRDNYDYLNSKDINWDTCTDIESDSLFDAVLNKLGNIKNYFGFISFKKREWAWILNDLIQIYPNIDFI